MNHWQCVDWNYCKKRSYKVSVLVAFHITWPTFSRIWFSTFLILIMLMNSNSLFLDSWPSSIKPIQITFPLDSRVVSATWQRGRHDPLNPRRRQELMWCERWRICLLVISQAIIPDKLICGHSCRCVGHPFISTGHLCTPPLHPHGPPLDATSSSPRATSTILLIVNYGCPKIIFM